MKTGTIHRSLTSPILWGVILFVLIFNNQAIMAKEFNPANPQRIIARGDNNYPPFEFLDNDGKPAGYNVDIFRAVAHVMDFDSTIKLGPWNEVRRELENGKIDLLIGMFQSEDRDKLADFSTPHLIINHAIFVRKGSPIRSEPDLMGKEIIVQQGDIMDDYAKSKKISDRLISVESQPDGLRLLASGKHDCFLGVEQLGIGIVDKYRLKNVITVGEPLYPKKYGFAVPEGRLDLLAKLNEGLQIIRNTGEYQDIYEKWIGGMKPTGIQSSVVIKYAMMVLIPLLLLLFVAVMWSWSLKKHVNAKTEALRESESKYRQLVDYAPAGIYEIDYHTQKIVSVNDVMCEYTGYTKNEILTMDPLDLLAEESRPIFLDRLQKVKNGLMPSDQVEYRIRRKDGREIWGLGNIKFHFEDEQLVRATAVFHDITERKQGEEALKASEERFRELSAFLPQTIFETDEKGTLLFINQNAFDVFLYEHEDFDMGLNALDMIAEEDRDRAFANMLKVMNGKILGPVQYACLRKDGTTFPAVIHSNPIIRHGEIVGLRGILIDTTAQRELESQLRHAQKMEAIGTLAGGIAHDFNNILAAVIGYTELSLSEVETGTPLYNNLSEVLKAGTRAKDLVKQILAMSRQEDQEIKPVDIIPLIKEALKMLRSTIPTTIDFRENILSKQLIVNADATQIHQVVVNLATNAAHAMSKQGGILEIAVDTVSFDKNIKNKYPDVAPGNYVRLAIRDTGTGIEKELLDKIFEPYFTTKEKGVGTGMGLYIVHGIVKAHKGHVRVQSEPGKGTTFYVYLPLAKGSLTELPVYANDTLSGGDESILIVDDEAPIVKIQHQILEGLGYKITTRTSSIEALEAFRSNPDRFDLVITDMTMPNMTGDRFAHELKKIRPDVLVMLCTGFSERVDSDNESSEIDGFLMKPVDRASLAKAVRELLDKAKEVG